MVNDWNLWKEFMKLEYELERTFENFLNRDFFGFRERPLLEGSKDRYRKALTDFSEKDNELLIRIELPGIKKEDIVVRATEDYIEVKAGSKDEVTMKNEKKGICKMEKRYKGFYKRIMLPEKVNIENIKTKYENGVLEISVPKSKEKKDKKIIKVEVK